MVMEVGRVCAKIAGRDAQNKCVIVDIVDNNYVLIDGQVRRKRCNVRHLEPLQQIIDLKKGASHEEVIAVFKKLGIEVTDSKAKEAKERPRKQRKVKEQVAEKEAEQKSDSSK